MHYDAGIQFILIVLAGVDRLSSGGSGRWEEVWRSEDARAIALLSGVMERFTEGYTTRGYRRAEGVLEHLRARAVATV